MTYNKGMLFVFEGVDDVGKSSLIEKIVSEYEQQGLEISSYSFPGKEKRTLGNLVYSIHHSSNDYINGNLEPISLQMLHIAAHIDLLKKQIIPDLCAGKVVLLDRCWWSTYVYGSVIGEINKKMLKHILAPELEIWRNLPIYKYFVIQRNPSLYSKQLELRAKMEDRYYLLAEFEPLANCVSNNENISSVVHSIKAEMDSIIRSNNRRLAKRIHKHNNIQISSPDKMVPSKMYNTYWEFASKRQQIYVKRLEGKPAPWTEDKILQRYKFTNVYRASDRVSQYLIRNVIYPQNHTDYTAEDIAFRILLYKIFNKMETWELLMDRLGDITYLNYSYENYNQILSDAFEQDKKIYSAAYIMPSVRGIFKQERKHQSHLRLLEFIMKDNFVHKLGKAKSLKDVFELLLSYPSLGNFLAFQYSIDLNYSELCDFDEMSFVVAGPGAKRGIQKCFQSVGKYSDLEVIRYMSENQQHEFERLELPFYKLGNQRPLQLIDCQNLFCETDKYTRVAFASENISGNGKRIKQLYKNKYVNHIEYFYPPKWGIDLERKE